VVAELSEQHKEAIVLLLARMRMPAEVTLVMREEFDIEVEIKQIIRYDPTRSTYEAGEKWLAIFEAARETYLKDVAAVPVANQGFRLNVLQRGIEAAVKNKNWKLAAELTEQASKEVGGVFTNVRDLNVNDGRGRARDLTTEERRELLAGKMAEALEGKQPVANAPGTPTAQ
jgi:hypothetical protein